MPASIVRLTGYVILMVMFFVLLIFVLLALGAPSLWVDA